MSPKDCHENYAQRPNKNVPQKKTELKVGSLSQFLINWYIQMVQDFIWLVVEPTHFKNISQIGSFPQGLVWK